MHVVLQHPGTCHSSPSQQSNATQGSNLFSCHSDGRKFSHLCAFFPSLHMLCFYIPFPNLCLTVTVSPELPIIAEHKIKIMSNKSLEL